MVYPALSLFCISHSVLVPEAALFFLVLVDVMFPFFLVLVDVMFPFGQGTSIQYIELEQEANVHVVVAREGVRLDIAREQETNAHVVVAREGAVLELFCSLRRARNHGGASLGCPLHRIDSYARELPTTLALVDFP